MDRVGGHAFSEQGCLVVVAGTTPQCGKAKQRPALPRRVTVRKTAIVTTLRNIDTPEFFSSHSNRFLHGIADSKPSSTQPYFLCYKHTNSDSDTCRNGAAHNTGRLTLRAAACIRRRGWVLAAAARRLNNALVDKRGRKPKLYAVSITPSRVHLPGFVFLHAVSCAWPFSYSFPVLQQKTLFRVDFANVWRK